MLQKNLKLDLRIATVRNNYSAFTNTGKSNFDKNDSQRTTNNHLFFKVYLTVKECSQKYNIVETVRNTARTETLQLFQINSKKASFLKI